MLRRSPTSLNSNKAKHLKSMPNIKQKNVDIMLSMVIVDMEMSVLMPTTIPN